MKVVVGVGEVEEVVREKKKGKKWIENGFPSRMLRSAGPSSSRGAEREAARHQSGGWTGGARGGEGSSVGRTERKRQSER